MALKFEWDKRKAKVNKRKHRITFEEATTVFGDPLSITIHDPAHSIYEDRFITIGTSYKGMLLVVIHTEEADLIRIISARKAAASERRQYEQ